MPSAQIQVFIFINLISLMVGVAIGQALCKRHERLKEEAQKNRYWSR